MNGPCPWCARIGGVADADPYDVVGRAVVNELEDEDADGIQSAYLQLFSTISVH